MVVQLHPGVIRARHRALALFAGFVVAAASGAAMAQETEPEAPPAKAAETPEVAPAATTPPAAAPATSPPAAEAPVAKGPSDSARFKVHSVNLNPIGVLFGSYSVNYQHLFATQHALLVEGRFGYSNADDVEATSVGGTLGYRWMWSGEQDSGFVGVNFAYDNGTAGTTVDGTSYDVTLSQLSILPNIGRRWAWDGGFNITLRFGVGRAFRTLSTNSDSAEAKEAVQDVQDFLDKIPVALDTELSVGWVF